MNYQPEELAERLKVEGAAVEAFFQDLSPEQWEQVVYIDKTTWQVRDILAHFIAAEQGFQQLIQNISTGGSGAGLDFDIEEYNRRTVQQIRGQEREVLLGQYAMARERTIALVRALRPEQLGDRGRHPWIGEAPLTDIIRAIYHHNSLHLRDIRKMLKSPHPGQSIPVEGVP
jgi:hypothetical protein